MTTLSETLAQIERSKRLRGRVLNAGIAPQKPVETPGLLSDIGNEVAIGGLQIGRAATDLAGFDKGSQFLQGVTQDRVQALSPEQRAADQNNVIVDDKNGIFGQGLGKTPGRSLLGAVAQSVPSVGAGIVTGGGLTALIRGTILAGARKNLIAKGATEALAKSDISSGVAGFSIGEGLVGGASNRLGVRDKVLAMKPEVLSQSPEYNKYLQQGMTPDQAKTALADVIGRQTFLTTGITTGLLGSVAGRTFGRLFGEAKVPTTRLGNVLDGLKAEGLQEAAQGAAEQPLSNIALQRADPTQDAFEGTLNNIITGSIAGGALGGAVGAIAPVHTADTQDVQDTAQAPDAPSADDEEKRIRTETASFIDGKSDDELKQIIDNREEAFTEAKNKGLPESPIQTQLDVLYEEQRNREDTSAIGQTNKIADGLEDKVNEFMTAQDIPVDTLNDKVPVKLSPGDLGNQVTQQPIKEAGIVGGKELPVAQSDKEAINRYDKQLAELKTKGINATSFVTDKNGGIESHHSEKFANRNIKANQEVVPDPNNSNRFAVVNVAGRPADEQATTETPKPAETPEEQTLQSEKEPVSNKKETVTPKKAALDGDLPVQNATPEPVSTLEKTAQERKDSLKTANATQALDTFIKQGSEKGHTHETTVDIQSKAIDAINKGISNATDSSKMLNLHNDLKAETDSNPQLQPVADAALAKMEEIDRANGIRNRGKVGDKHGVMGTPSELTDIKTIDGVNYELYKPQEEGGKAHIRGFDEDSGNVISIHQYTDSKTAKAEFSKIIESAQKAATPEDLTGIKLNSDGKPFKSEKIATQAIANSRDIKADTHEAVKVDGGFGIRLKNKTNQDKTRIGKVGDKIGEGEVVLTSSGRETTPFPKLSFDSNRKAVNTEKRVSSWLRDNAISEAKSRNDAFNSLQFESYDAKNLSTSDKDSMEEYLFGEQPNIVTSILHPLGANKNVKGEAPYQLASSNKPAPESKPASELTAADFDTSEAERKLTMDKLTNGIYTLDDKTFDSYEDLPDNEVPAEYRAIFDKDGADLGIIADIDLATKVRDFEEADALIKQYQARVKAEKSRVLTKPAGKTGTDTSGREGTGVPRDIENGQGAPLKPNEKVAGSGVDDELSLTDIIRRDFNSITDNNGLKRAIAESIGANTRGVTNKQLKEAQELLEPIIFEKATAIVDAGKSDKDIFDSLVKLYEHQPRLDVRSSTSIKNQAYSTPSPIAFIAARMAGVNKKTKIYEPTAGNGMLLITAGKDNAIVNELNTDRATNLRNLGFSVTERDATESVPLREYDSLLVNPPFGSLKNSDGSAKILKLDGFPIVKIDQAIVAKALDGLTKDGTASIIIGASRNAGGISSSDRKFFNWLYSHYNVTSHFDIDGKLYARQGASFPIRVITVHGRESSNKVSPLPNTIERATTWEQVYDKFEHSMDSVGRDAGSSTTSTDSTQETQNDIRPSDGAGGEDALPNETGGSGRNGSGSGNSTGNSGGHVGTPIGHSGKSSDDGQPINADGTSGHPTTSGTKGAATNGSKETSGRNDNRGNDGGDRESRKRVLRDAEKEASDFQAAYISESKGFNEKVLTPSGMAIATKNYLKDLSKKIKSRGDGDIDTFTMNKLGYTDNEQFKKSFMGLQVDAIASAIENNEQENQATIIADQTGVGKGRQAAGIIRYALKNGKIPIFVTEKENLFTDIFDDMKDIFMDGVSPLIMNNNSSIKNKETGAAMFKDSPAKRNAKLRGIIQSGALPKEHNMLMMTYSQIDRDSSWKRDIIPALGDNVMLILDESHNISGQRSKIKKVNGENVQTVTRAGYFFNVINEKQVVYLSATFAKRADNMPIYYRTALSDAVDTIDNLVQAVQAGGVPLQTVISNTLARMGQLFRRERSFKGIKILPKVDRSSETEQVRFSDAMNEGLRAIAQADATFNSVFFNDVKDAAAASGGTAGHAGNRASQGLDHHAFSSVIHNYISQVLTAIKADSAIKNAIDNHNSGKKVVIGLSNTMQSALEKYVEDNDISHGDVINLSFRDMLQNALDGSRHIKTEDAKGNDVKRIVPLSELDPVTRAAYARAQGIIDNIKGIENLPVSPIDYIINKLEKEGISVGEITGRKNRIDYSGSTPTFQKRDDSKPSQRRDTVDRFNNGTYDALIINKAGSTGLSIHASEKFKNLDGSKQKPRHMIVLQADADINVLVQMLGRINRTGQKEVPSYDILSTALPSEERPLAVTMGKLKQLNANTSANSESDLSFDAPDLFNRYGDEIVASFLFENQDLAKKLGLLITTEDAAPIPDIALKFTGRAAVLPAAQLSDILEQINSEYSDYIDYLTKSGQNKLIARAIDLAAKIKDSVIAYQGNGKPGFGGDAILHEISSKRIGKPPKADEVQSAIDKSLKGGTSDEFSHSLIDRHADSLAVELSALDAKEESQISSLDTKSDSYTSDVSEIRVDIEAQRERIKNTSKDTRTKIFNRYKVGSKILLTTGEGETTIAVVTGIDNKFNGKGNPYAPSKWKISLMVNSGIRQVKLPLSKLTTLTAGNASRLGSIESIFKGEGTESRETRHVVTGNLVAGMAAYPTGEIVAFTDDKNKSHQGIFLPKSFSKSDAADRNIKMSNNEVAVKFMKNNRAALSEDGGLFNSGGVIRIRPDGNNNWEISIPKSGKEQITKDVRFSRPLQDAMGEEFFGKGKFMHASFPDSKLNDVFHILNGIAPMYTMLANKDAFKAAGGSFRDTAPQSFDGSLLAKGAFEGKSTSDHVKSAVSDIVGNAVTAKVVTSLPNDQQGRLLVANKIIEVANNIDDPVQVAWHESFHALQNYIFNKQQIDVMNIAFDDGKFLRRSIESIMRKNGLGKVVDSDFNNAEAQAYAFQAYKSGKFEPKGLIARLFSKLRDIIEKAQNLIRGNGFTSAESIFKQASSGEFATGRKSADDITDNLFEKRNAFNHVRAKEIIADYKKRSGYSVKRASPKTVQDARLNADTSLLTGTEEVSGVETATFEKAVVPTEALIKLPDEHGKDFEGVYHDLASDMKDNGYDFDSPVDIFVDKDGFATVNDGNQRIHAAALSGITQMSAKIHYFNGGEAQKGALNPDVIGMEGATSLDVMLNQGTFDGDKSAADLKSAMSKIGEPDKPTWRHRASEAFKARSILMGKILLVDRDAAILNKETEDYVNASPSHDRKNFKEHDASVYVTFRQAAHSDQTASAMINGGHDKKGVQVEWGKDEKTGDDIVKVIDGKLGLFGILSQAGESESDVKDLLTWRAGRRLQRLSNEDKEQRFSDEEIEAMISVGEDHKNFNIFKKIDDQLNEFDRNKLRFALESGSITETEMDNLLQDGDYISLAQVEEDLLKGRKNKKGVSFDSGISAIKGGKLNVDDLLKNMQTNVVTIIHKAWQAQALRAMDDMFIIGHETDRELVLEAYQKGESVPGTFRKGNKIVVTNSKAVPEKYKKKPVYDRETYDRAIPLLKQQRAIASKEALEAAKGSGLDSIEDADGMVNVLSVFYPEDGRTISFIKNGKRVFRTVKDETFMAAVLGLNRRIVNPYVNALLGAPKRFLTAMITASPAFGMANGMRDTINVAATTDAKINLLTDPAKGFMSAFNKDDSFLSAQVNAGLPTAGYRTDLSASGIKRFLKDVQDDQFGKHSLGHAARKAAHFYYNDIVSNSENANRMAAFKALVDDGMSIKKAAFIALDTMDFGLTGSSELMLFFHDTVPFFNSRVQGLYRLKRGFSSHRKSVIMYGGIIALASTLMALANADDERYRGLPEYEKDNYWIGFIGGQKVRYPKPFEMGLMFGTLPERIVELFHDGLSSANLARFRERVAAGFGSTLSLNPTPQTLKVIREIATNTNLYTDRSIVPVSRQFAENQYQYSPNTSTTSKAVARITNAIFPDIGVLKPIESPAVMDHVIFEFTGDIGRYTVQMADAFIEYADSNFNKTANSFNRGVPFLSRFVSPEDKVRGSKYTDKMFEMYKVVIKNDATMSALKKDKDMKGLAAFRAEHRQQIVDGRRIKRAVRVFSNINKAKENIVRAGRPDISEKLKAFDKRKVEIAKPFYELREHF